VSRARFSRALSLVAAVALAGTACSSDEGSDVAVGNVESRTVVEVVEAPAAVTASGSAEVSAGADGFVASLEVRDGKRVKAGDVIMLLSSPEAEQALAAAREADAQAAAAGQVSLPEIPASTSAARLDERAGEAFAAARAAAMEIEDPDVRHRALSEVATAEADFAAVQADAAAVAGQLNAAIGSLGRVVSGLAQAQRVQTQAAVRVAEQRVASLTVTAPISGRVSLGLASAASGGAGDIDISAVAPELAGAAAALGAGGSTGGGGDAVGVLTEGSVVSTGQRLATITDVSSLALVAEVDETDVLLVSPGTRARMELDALPGARYRATVTSVDVAPTPSSRGGVAYRVRLELGSGKTEDGSAASPPRPGMSAVVQLRVKRVKDAVAVPVTAVFRDGQGDALWVVDNDEARRQSVRLGAQGQDYLEVLEGVRLGQQIVVAGADQVSEGDDLADLEVG
jgi:HlyD family secretion protein